MGAETARTVGAFALDLCWPEKVEQKSNEQVWHECMTERGWQKVSKYSVDLSCSGIIEGDGNYERFAPPGCLTVELDTRLRGAEMKILKRKPDDGKPEASSE